MLRYFISLSILWTSQRYKSQNSLEQSRAPGWLSWLSVLLQLRSWSHGLWVQALHWALCWQLRAWSLLWILCLLLSLPLPDSRSCLSLSLPLSKINIKKERERDRVAWPREKLLQPHSSSQAPCRIWGLSYLCSCGISCPVSTQYYCLYCFTGARESTLQ